MHPSYLRQFHASQIFHALRAHPGITQRELAELSGCDKSTVSLILKRFEDIGLVERYAGNTNGRPGRTPEVLRISSLTGLLIGMHLEFETMRIVAAGIDGTRISMKSYPIPKSPEDLAEVTRNGIAELCQSIDRDVAEIRSVGVTLPGLVASGGGLAQSSNLKWYSVAVPELLQNITGAPVYIDNDTNAATMAEYLFGACGHLSDFIMLDSGIGLGGGIFLDGRLFRGKSGFSGELGHIKVVKDGRICGCGSCGCLSAYLSEPAIVQRAARVLPVTTLEELFALAAAGDRDALNIFYEAGGFLGIALSNLTNIFNTPAIVLGGLLARMWPYIEASTRRSLEDNAMRAPLADLEIITSDLSLEPLPSGGIALALEGFTALGSL